MNTYDLLRLNKLFLGLGAVCILILLFLWIREIRCKKRVLRAIERLVKTSVENKTRLIDLHFDEDDNIFYKMECNFEIVPVQKEDKNERDFI